MKRVLILLLVVSSVRADYKKIEAYGDTLYNLIDEYVRTNSTSSSQDVANYVNSDATKTIFSDALNSGYSRDKVLFACYQASFQVTPPIDAIVSGMRDVVQKQEALNNALYYSSWANIGVTGTMMLGLIRWIYVYLRFDKPVINWIRSQRSNNSLRFTNTNTSNNVSSTTPLIVPEPWFPGQ